jgi:hypothetical protein
MDAPDDRYADLAACPCCEYGYDPDHPWDIGGYWICPVCNWEDCLAQRRYFVDAGGPNAICLLDAQENFRRHGRCEQPFEMTMPPGADDCQHPDFRPITDLP